MALSITLSHKVRHKIAVQIISGELGPGVRLSEAALALRLNVSRTPIREALRDLNVLGLVDSKPHCGGQVVQCPRQAVVDLLATLEGKCVEAVAADHHCLDALNAQDLSDPTAWRRVIWNAVQKPTITSLIETYWSYLEESVDLTRHDPAQAEAILSAIRLGQGDRASGLMASYLEALCLA